MLVRERLAKDANDVDALFVLAAIETQEGNVDDGIRTLDRVLMMDPRYPGAWFFKEKLHKMRGEPEKAADARTRGEATEA